MLAYTTLGDENAPLGFYVHGILGSGKNWRTIARRVAGARGERAVLVDLRNHGDSQNELPPDTLASAAADILRVAEALGRPIHSILGHSFGGKVALTVAERAPAGLTRVDVIDASPSARPERREASDVPAIVRALGTLPRVHATKTAFQEAAAAAGVPKKLGPWLAMQLREAEGGFRFAPEIPRVQAMLDDYFVQDLWGPLEAPREGVRYEMVVGTRSEVYADEDRGRLRTLAARHPAVGAHFLDAGHWVHVDARDALLSLLEDV